MDRQYPIHQTKDRQFWSMLKHYKDWTDSVDIEFTPTLFINGRQLPEFYSIKDL